MTRRTASRRCCPRLAFARRGGSWSTPHGRRRPRGGGAPRGARVRARARRLRRAAAIRARAVHAAVGAVDGRRRAARRARSSSPRCARQPRSGREVRGRSGSSAPHLVPRPAGSATAAGAASAADAPVPPRGGALRRRAGPRVGRVDGPIGTLPGVIEHFSYETWEDCRTKLVQYARAGAEARRRAGRRGSIAGVAWRPFARFVRMYVLQLGVLDGAHGSRCARWRRAGVAAGRWSCGRTGGASRARRLTIAHLDTGRTWRGGQPQVLLLVRGLARSRLPAAAAGARRSRWRARVRGGTSRSALAAARGPRPGAPHSRPRALCARPRPTGPCHSAHAHAVGGPAARLAGVPAVVVSRRVDFRSDACAQPAQVPAAGRPIPCLSAACATSCAPPASPTSGCAGAERNRAPGPPGPGACAALLAGSPSTRSSAWWHPSPAQEPRGPALDARSTWCADTADAPPRPDRRGRSAGRRSKAAPRARGRGAVHLPGFRDDARALLRQFDLFALASFAEGLGTSRSTRRRRACR